jgi:hypothetical protein
MSIDGRTLDAAYEIYEEFGSLRRIPRVQRLPEEYPRLTESELDVLMNEMKEISKTVWSIAERGGEGRLGREKVIALLQSRHPYLQRGA